MLLSNAFSLTYSGIDSVFDSLKKYFKKSLSETDCGISRACLFELSQEKGSVSVPGSSLWPALPSAVSMAHYMAIVHTLVFLKALS